MLRSAPMMMRLATASSVSRNARQVAIRWRLFGPYSCIQVTPVHRVNGGSNKERAWTQYYSGPVSVRPFSFVSSPTTEPDHNGDERGLFRLLTEEERALLAEQRDLSQKARGIASQVGTVQVRDFTSRFLEDILPDNDDEESTFSIVVAGEFNAGKSTVINALLGKKLLKTGALPTTDSITILLHGTSDDTQHNFGGRGGVVLHQVANVPLLEDLTLVDTPGTNAVIADHTARTMKLLPTADLILFVTSADRPFPESERILLQSIQAYRKSIVVVVNKMDVLETSGGNYGEQQKEQVVDFVAENASELLGARPIVIPISARDALSAKLTGGRRMDNSRIWKRSNFSALESFLKDSLTTETKIKSKLLNPIGVSEGMMGECMSVLKERRKELKTDVATLNLLQSQFEGWKKEMDGDMDSFRKEVREMLFKEGERCQILCSRMSYVNQYSWTLVDTTRFDSEWGSTKQAIRVADSGKAMEAQLEEIVRETADGVATRARAQGQAVIEYLGKRPAMKSQSLVGNVTGASRFEDTKKTLTEKMSDSVRNVLSDLDETTERDTLLASFRSTMVIAGIIHLGAIAAACATAVQVLDTLAGIAASSSLAVLGAYFVSYRNSKTINEYQRSWTERATNLDRSLEALCAKELLKVQRRILDGVSPYTRYVETEQESVQRLTEQCEDVLAEAHGLRNRISKLRHDS